MNDNQETDFMTWFESLSDEEQKHALAAMREVADKFEQARIDAIARELLADVEITL